MGTLKSIVGVRCNDFVKNADIKEMLGQPSVLLKLREARMIWFGHVEKMDEAMQVKRIIQAEMQERRLVGRFESDGDICSDKTWRRVV